MCEYGQDEIIMQQDVIMLFMLYLFIVYICFLNILHVMYHFMFVCYYLSSVKSVFLL